MRALLPLHDRLRAIGRIPGTAVLAALRRVVLQYTDWGFDDVLDQCRLLPLPAQVAALVADEQARYLDKS